VRITSPKRHWHFVVHPSPNEQGRWQLTDFEGDLPWGHTTWSSRQAAIDAACGKWADNQPPVGDSTFSIEEAK